VLKQEVVQAEGSMRTQFHQGAYTVLQGDGWKDISKKHLVAFMHVTQRKAYVLHVHDISAKRKTGENIFALMESEYEYIQDMLKLKCIGMCGDTASDERKGRMNVPLHSESYLTMSTCKLCLILGDYYKQNPQVKSLVDEAILVIKWFNNHSYALGVLNEEQMSMYKKSHALIMPVVTRWTSNFCALDRLLDIWKAIQMTSIKHEDRLVESVGQKHSAKTKATQVLALVKDTTWWKALTAIKLHIEPLAIATNVSQGATTRCDQVLLILGNLLEKRWAKADQDLFIACLFLNPFINSNLIDANTLSVAIIMGITRRLYLRVFQLDVPPPDLIHEVYDYAERKNRYSPDCWPIEDLRRRRDNPSEDCNVDPISAWTIISQDSSLVKLAILVLSFVPNSASMERLFSSMGHTKTKTRSCLGIQKNRDIAFLKMELRRRH
ncbi:hypothetical protein WOLCODRAFT_44498, partial [Wolfiporia cocos MD-104 SS10]